MLKKLLIGAAALSLAASMAFGAQGVKFFVANGDKEKEHMTLVNEKIQAIGFVLSDPHERINDAYKTKYGGTNLDNLGFFSITRDSVIGPLLMKEPALGGFSPFNLHVYKKESEDKTYVGHVMPETMLDIVGAKDKETREKFIASFTDLDNMIAKEISPTVQMVDYKALPEKPMMTFEVPFEGSLDAFISDFQGKFEEKFEANHYIIAGYKDIKGAMTDNNVEFGRFDAYWVYSLCHFKFSESIFNQGRPDAGVFAPCSMYMYVDKGTNKLMVGMPKLENWIAVMGIKEPKMVDAIHALDAEIINIMKELGAKEL